MAVVSSFPAAVDYLVGAVAALPAFASPVLVFDGWPTQGADRAIVIGITPEDPDSENSPQYAEVGAQTEWEVVDIPCVLWAEVGGDNMKTARDRAFELFDAVQTLMRTVPGRTLGGAVKSNAAAIRNVRVEQTGTASAAGAGRRCDIRFTISYRSRSTA